jgi:nucleoside-diphosphate-sugar epimerase
MLLTAKQAQEITGQSDAAHDKIISDILDEVRRVAETGKSEILHSRSLAYLANEFFKIEKLPFQPPEFTENQFAVVNKLKELGYQVKVVDEGILVLDSHDNYVSSTIPVVQISW